MKKATGANGEMRDHYDFAHGIRGKYAARYAQGTNVVVIDADVAKLFPDRESVNEALRAVGHVVQMREQRRTRANRGAVVRSKPAASRPGRGS